MINQEAAVDWSTKWNPNHLTKKRMKWQQSTVEAENVIRGLTVENKIVLDPFMDSGTTGIAALKLHRKFIGVE